jgi:putative Ca2+/H+ antiporter (TMEM165/GDT1 family)
MILVSEVGDKTFLVAALMAMKHDRMVVFSAAFGALLVMTVLSAVLGHAVPALISKRLTSLAAAGLFFVFGAKLLKEGMEMDPNEGVSAEMHEVERELAEKEKELGRNRNGMLSADALEMGMNGRSSRSSGRFPSPARSPSQSPVRRSTHDSGSLSGMLHGISNLSSLLLSPAWVQTFVMTFLGEWGDRSQIATIAMAAGQDYWWVTLGAMFGHAICTGVAVVGGRAIAGRVSMKVGKYNSWSPLVRCMLLTLGPSYYRRRRCLFAIWSHLLYRIFLRLDTSRHISRLFSTIKPTVHYTVESTLFNKWNCCFNLFFHNSMLGSDSRQKGCCIFATQPLRLHLPSYFYYSLDEASPGGGLS